MSWIMVGIAGAGALSSMKGDSGKKGGGGGGAINSPDPFEVGAADFLFNRVNQQTPSGSLQFFGPGQTPPPPQVAGFNRGLTPAAAHLIDGTNKLARGAGKGGGPEGKGAKGGSRVPQMSGGKGGKG